MDLLNSDKLTEHINKLLDDWHTPGISIAILQDGKVQSKAYGKASLNPPKPFTPDTLVDIASSSKSLTAAAVGLLGADDEHFPQVQWDSKMSSLLPDDFVMSEQSYTDDITVEDILSHRTGFPRHVRRVRFPT
jgi:CubicO group peptidase (beta-lactamase class C family)